jgi:hypothetical protein
MVLLSKSKVMFWRKVVNENLSRSVGKAVDRSERGAWKKCCNILRRQQYQCKTCENILKLNKYKSLLTKDSRKESKQ